VAIWCQHGYKSRLVRYRPKAMSDGYADARAKVRVTRWVRRGRLAAIREDADLTQGELARALNVSQSSVSRWESGDTLPRARHAAALVELLDGESS
jgi:DNA-binding transcriptional regulator YiaG